jgi:hypothetical protein
LKVFGIEIAHNNARILQSSLPILYFRGKGLDAVRSTIINKILSFQYRLGKIIGRKKAGQICSFVERVFTNLFGREVYYDRK